MAFGKILRPVFDPGLAVAPWWKVAGKTCVAAYQPKGAASLAASYVNLANPGTYDAAPGVAPTLTADGWGLNGTTQYLKTGIVPNSLAWSCLVRYSSATWNINRASFGCGSGSAVLFFEHYDGDTYYANGNLVMVSGVPATSGVAGVAGLSAYFNGGSVGSIPGGGTTPASEIWIGARDLGIPTWFFLGNIQALVIYSDTLTAGEVATVSAVMATL